MRSIFLSYRKSDELFVSRLIKNLQYLNFQVYQDCIITLPEKTLLENMLSLQKRIDFVIIILSKLSSRGTITDSYWNEVILDTIIHGRTWLIPVLIQKCDLPMYIFPSYVEDFSIPSAYSSAFKKLTSRMKVI
jgi:hypothetical protein